MKGSLIFLKIENECGMLRFKIHNCIYSTESLNFRFEAFTVFSLLILYKSVMQKNGMERIFMTPMIAIGVIQLFLIAMR